MSTKLELFVKKFNSVEHTLSTDVVLECENGTGYFDSMVNLDAPTGVSVSKFIDQNGRRGIVYYTRMGNVAVFERYAKESDLSGVIASNAPNWWSAIFPERAVSNEVLDLMELHDNYPARIVLEFIEQKELWDEHHETKPSQEPPVVQLSAYELLNKIRERGVKEAWFLIQGKRDNAILPVGPGNVKLQVNTLFELVSNSKDFTIDVVTKSELDEMGIDASPATDDFLSNI